MPGAEPATELAQARAALRAMLSRYAPRLGLTAAAVAALVDRAEITAWTADRTICAAGDAADVVGFVVSGVVKVMCQGDRRAPVVVQFVPPGQFFRLAWPADAPREHGFEAVAHVPSVVASVSTAVMTDVVGAMPPGCALQMMAYSWRGLSRHLYDKCRLLTMPLRDRLLHELQALARDFGREHPAGVVIEVPLTHGDLAGLAVGTRANVTRAVAALRGAGRLAVVGGRFVLLADPRLRLVSASSSCTAPASRPRRFCRTDR
jgi:CRP/FNR family transcriptional regulator